MFASIPDLLRLVAVPVLAWAAWRDVEVRRVPNVTWYPLAALGVVLLAWEALSPRTPLQLYLLRVGVSVGFVVPLTFLFWRLGGFGGADAKALMALALLFPTFPTYSLAELPVVSALPWAVTPVVETQLGVFSWTILTNTVLLGVLYPLALAVRNALVGEFSTLMFVGRAVRVTDLPAAHGRLFEDDEGFTWSGLDVDALRMYLRWRGVTLSDLRSDPARYRDPATIGETHDPTDGAVGREAAPDGGVTDDGPSDEDGPVDGDGPRRTSTGATPDPADAGGADEDAPADAAEFADAIDAPDAAETADPWGAAAFLDEIEGTAYGTTPERLRGGLNVVTERDEVWLSPGIPFLVPMFAGLAVGLTYGDLLFGLLAAVGLV